ncbi:GNAT family N-acetyltransferase [Actinobaculum suis]|uniref:GNAT family N-acetyltransferase n=1 Tax=Actinobaculum suis TaxID=1657 RepID=UPI00066FBC4A|nr:GNAT family N-acetyltransferase [Actinobaculum suis]OCA94757.1 hypothetical protein ACU21_06100 [Actinobaculum suis]
MVREITPAEVAEWAERALAHATNIRQRAGLLDAVSGPAFATELRDEFRVGLPRDDRTFVNADLSQWIWISSQKRLTVRDARVEAAEPWLPALREATGGKEFTISTFAGCTDADPILAACPHRLRSIEMAAALPSIAVVPAGTPDVTLRTMTSRELRDFLEITSDELAEQQLGTHPDKTYPELKKRALMRARHQLSDGVSTPGHELFAIVVNGRDVGGMWAQQDGPRVRVWSLVVYQDYRGRSYSRAALAQIAIAMSFRGVRFMSVPLVSTNTHARSIFELGGFKLARKNFCARAVEA